MADRRAQPVGDLPGPLDRGFGHRYRELIATDARADVRCAYHALELLCDKAESTIACAMTLAVVDAFQVVEVDHHHRQSTVVSLAECDLALHHTLELSAVGKPREVIGSRLAGKLSRAIQRDCDLVCDSGRLHRVKRSPDRGDDRGQAVHLTLPRPMLRIEVVEIAARDRCRQSLSNVLQPALGNREDLVAPGAVIERQRDELDRCTPVNGEDVDERYKRYTLRGAQPSEGARALLVVTPRLFDVRAQ